MSAFTERLVQAAKAHWAFFGNAERNLDGTTRDGLKEYQDDASQRIAEYWQFIGGDFAQLTGKDRGTPWSAAFISFCMNEAGAGERFDYAAAHATFINQAIRARDSADASALFLARKRSEHYPQVGDLVGYWRGERRITVDNARSIGWYQSHTDIVIEVGDRLIYVIGGNVGHSVTRKQLRTNRDGRLTDSKEPWFVVMQNQT